jgi:hypothetical protein
MEKPTPSPISLEVDASLLVVVSSGESVLVEFVLSVVEAVKRGPIGVVLAVDVVSLLVAGKIVLCVVDG